MGLEMPRPAKAPILVFVLLIVAIFVALLVKDWQNGLITIIMCVASCITVFAALAKWGELQYPDFEGKVVQQGFKLKVYTEQTTNSRVLIDSNDVLHLIRTLKFVDNDVYFEAISPAIGSILPVIVKYWALNCTMEKFKEKHMSIITVRGRENKDGKITFLIPKQARDEGYEHFQEHVPDVDPFEFEDEEEEK